MAPFNEIGLIWGEQCGQNQEIHIFLIDCVFLYLHVGYFAGV